jgi:2-phospho-L-lactate/phosphoenolpyruvate guanylyltransferase
VPAIVVPFRGSGAKARLAPLPGSARGELALAMLGDVVAACRPVGETIVVTDDAAARVLARGLGAEAIADPGRGQGAAVGAALARLGPGAVLVVNADLPCVVPDDLRELVRVTPAAGVALVAADDRTTNALSLPSPAAFAPLYGPGSVDRFRSHAGGLGLRVVAPSIRNLRDDVDTLTDLQRVGDRAGPRTQAAMSSLGLAA